MKEKTEMTMTTETVVRRAYHAAEGNVMDVQGFIDLFRRRRDQRRQAELPRGAAELRSWASSLPTFTGNPSGSRHGKRRRSRALDPGHLHRAVRVAAGLIQGTGAWMWIAHHLLNARVSEEE
jgi:hypothetical protein